MHMAALVGNPPILNIRQSRIVSAVRSRQQSALSLMVVHRRFRKRRCRAFFQRGIPRRSVTAGDYTIC